MNTGAPASFGAYLKALRVAAGLTQEELAGIAGLSVHAISALERGERRRPHVDTVRALAAALALDQPARDALMTSARTTSVDDPPIDAFIDLPFPQATTGILGRDTDIDALVQWLGTPDARLVTLVGPGGVGKTRLSLEVGRRVAEKRTTRVGFVELASIRDPAFVAPAIADALGLSLVTPSDLARQLRAASAERHALLLVLDNCEQVLDAATVLGELLTTTPTLRMLATSRAPLRIRGERLYAVRPLTLPVDAERPVDEVARLPVVQLFVDRVRDVQPEFQVTPGNVRAVIDICRRLDGLPLALELAASWIKVLTMEGLALRLEQNILLPPTVSPRDVPERQQAMASTVAWSYQLLGPDEQRAFRRFGALPARFSIDAAAAVLTGEVGGSPNQALVPAAVLIERSLLHQAEGATPARSVYVMLETVRAYATLELSAAGERDATLEALAQYCGSEASRAEHGLTGPSQVHWLDRVRDDLDSYRNVLAWLIERRRSGEAADIAFRLMFFWLIRGRAVEGLEWYSRVLRLPEVPAEAESRLRLGVAVLSFAQGDMGRARDALTQALSIARQDDDVPVVVQGENLLGHLEHATGHLVEARALFERSHQGFTRLAVPWGIGNALIGRASVALAGGDADQAERLLDEATVVLRDAGPWFLNLPLYIHSIVAVQRGNPDAAIALADESLRCSLQLRDRFAFVYALIPLAAAAALKGHDEWTARILGARDAVTDRTGSTVATRAVQALRDRAEQQARDRLGAARWGRAYAAGRTASLDSLLQDIEDSRS